jgi:two-component system sensor histidine kinase PilS (NtrC family)
MINEEKYFPFAGRQFNKIQLLIIGRLLAVFLLLVSGWFWNSGYSNLSVAKFPSEFLIVFLIATGLTIAYFFILRLNKNYDLQIGIQFFLDSMLITWLVWRTGDLSSPYIPLYIVLISIAGIYLGLRGTLLIAVLCAVSFTGLVLLVVAGIAFSFSNTPETSKTIQIMAFHNVAFLVVGLLAARLSDRYVSGQQLKETTQSLTDLRVLHERIVESIRSGLITTDLEGIIYTFNAAAEEITGYKSQEMIGKSVFSLFGNIEYSITPSLEVTETGSSPLRFEADLTTPDDLIVHVGYTVSPLFSKSSETNGLIVTFQDLTEIRSMEESIRRKDRLAAVGRVAAGLAHEIRNPLGAMRGAIQVLQSQIPPETAQASLMDIVLRESDRLNNIITNFLSYARPNAGNFTKIDVREAISDTFTLLRHSPDIKQNHVLQYDLPERPTIISADPTQLKQIFWNLARNAIQAMPDGGTLKVALENLADKRVKIIFQDTGRGMSATQVEKLFEPFSESTTGGTGLGLSIVYQIVRDHGGTINVRSLEGSGTTITIELLPESNNQLADVNGNDKEQATRLGNFLTIRPKE